MDALLSKLPHAREHVHVLLVLSSRQQDVQGQVGPCSPDPGTVEKEQKKIRKKKRKEKASLWRTLSELNTQLHCDEHCGK